MTLKRIFRDHPEIKKAVYERHPKSEGEKTCKIEKRTMEWVRWNMAKRLMQEMTNSKIEFK